MKTEYVEGLYIMYFFSDLWWLNFKLSAHAKSRKRRVRNRIRFIQDSLSIFFSDNAVTFVDIHSH